MDGFRVKKGPQEFVVPEGSLDQFLNVEEQNNCKQITAVSFSDTLSDAILYILPSAFQELDNEIHWCANTSGNLVEQGGILVGKVFKDSERRVCGVVKHIIPSAKSGTATYIQFRHDDWITMYREFDQNYAAGSKEDCLQVIGWYHTHPNMPTNMSAIDKSTHIGFFSKEWQFSAIFNPQKGTWSVFNGTVCTNCRGVLFCPYYTVGTGPNFAASEPIQSEPEEPDVFQVDSGSTQEQGHGNIFIIHHRTDSQPSSPDTKQNDSRTALENGRTGVRKCASSQPRGGILIGQRSADFRNPFNMDTFTESESYTIEIKSREKVKHAVEYFSLSKSESIAFIYYLTPDQLLIPSISRPEEKISSRVFNLKLTAASKFIYYSGNNLVLEYSDGSCKSDAGSMAVVFSQTELQAKALSKRYGDCSCALWMNPNCGDSVLFYPLSSYGKEQKSTHRGARTCRGNFNQINYQTTIQLSSRKMRLIPELSNLLLEKIQYSAPTSDAFCVILDYECTVHDNGSGEIFLYPLLNQFKRLTLLKRKNCHTHWDLQMRYQNVSETGEGTPLLAVIISNRDIKGEYNSEPFRQALCGCRCVFAVKI